MNSPVHRIGRYRGACAKRSMKQVACPVPKRVIVPPYLAICRNKRDTHAVFRKRSGLVRAQNGGRTQCFDGSATAGQDTRAGDSPGPHRHEDGQHEGDLLWEDRHADGDASQCRLKPRPSQETK